MNLLTCKNLIEQIKDDLKLKLENLAQKPVLHTFLVGDDPGSISYQKSLEREAKALGLLVKGHVFDEEDKESFINDLKLLREDKSASILVFRPLPKSFDEEEVFSFIDPQADVDGCSEYNLYRLMNIDNYRNLPTTSLAILEYLKSVTKLEGKDVLIINRTNVVGKPLAMMLLNENATVTIGHSRTKNIGDLAAKADIIVSAIGRANHFKFEKLKEGAILIDAGVSLGDDGKYHGDIDSKFLEDKQVNYLPSKGQIGKLNSILIFKNAYYRCLGDNNE